MGGGILINCCCQDMTDVLGARQRGSASQLCHCRSYTVLATLNYRNNTRYIPRFDEPRYTIYGNIMTYSPRSRVK